MDDSFELHRRRRALFSDEVDAYDESRPGYPAELFARLRDTCGLGPGTRVVEIGPGTGQATATLLEAGARVVAVELGPELAARLDEKHGEADLDVVVGAFEDVDLDDAPLAPGAFDMVVAATSFHWVPPEVGLTRCARLLRPGGWLALWWTVFGDPSRPDPFHDALHAVLVDRAPELVDSSGGGLGAHPHALGGDVRLAEIAATGRFGEARHELFRWTGRHTPREIRRLFATFSPWIALEPDRRTSLLDEVEALARDRFGGLVERPYVTSLYLAPTEAAR